MINEFLDDIIKYLKQELKTEDVDNAYLSTETPKRGAIRVYVMDYSDIVNYEEFTDTPLQSIPMQIYIYQGQDTKKGYNAIQNSYILLDKVKQLFDKTIIKVNNNNVISVRFMGISPTLPVKEGTQIYVTALRYEFTISSPYQKIYKGE